MAKYNMVKHSFLTSTTFSGGGNKILSLTDLAALIDDSITTVATSITDSDILYLDVDMGSRLKVDNIFLYADDLTKLSHINFLFKNNEEDEFTICSKDMTPTAYIGTVPNPSAPRYIRCTISGVNLSLYELQILNNDEVVGFGVDGYLNETFLLDAPEGILGTIHTVDIFNNGSSDMPANAFICVDYTDTKDDEYIEIASSENGPFLNIKDAALKSPWDYGTFNNTLKSSINGREVLQLFLNSTVDNKNPQYICNLPDSTCYYPAKPCGVKRYTTYDHVNKRIYVIFWPGPSATTSVIKLWYYNILDNTWVFRGSLVSSLWNANYTAVCCDSSKVYFFVGLDDESRYIYEHALAGEVGNLTVKVQLPLIGRDVLETSIVSDFGNFIYVFTNYAGSIGPQSKDFYKIDINTNVITNLNNSFYSISSGYIPPIISYDYINNYIYFLSVDGSFTNDYFVSRYVVSSNSWTIQFFNYGARIYPNNTYVLISFYNNCLYFQSDYYSGKIYRYNFLTDLVSYVDTGIITNTTISNSFIVTEPLDSEYDASFFVFGGRVEAPYTLYGYNVPACFKNDVSYELPVEGTFTSQILSLFDRNYASYFKISNSSVLGLTSVSYSSDLQDGLIEVRSSDTPPLPFNKIFWPVTADSNQGSKFIIYDIFTNVLSYVASTLVGANSTQNIFSYIDRKTGKTLVMHCTAYYSHYTSIHIYNTNGQLIRSASVDTSDYIMSSNILLDVSEGVWFFNTGTYVLKHLDKNNNLIGSKVLQGLYHMDACQSSDGVWYVNRTTKTLIKIGGTLSTLVTINLVDPYQVCVNSDDSCWVIDNADPDFGKTIKKYSSLGILEKTIVTVGTFLVISSDFMDGFYVFSTNDTPQQVHHYDSNGNRTMVVSNLASDSNIHGGMYGVVMYSSILKRIRYIEKKSSQIVWTKYYSDIFTESNYSHSSPPVLFCFGIEEQNRYNNSTRLIPQSFEEHWGSSSNSLPWKVVPKDGYFLPKTRYHQVRLTLRNFDGKTTPYVHDIILAPAISITDIKPYESKPLFVRTNIPAGTELKQLSTRIKVWWDVYNS